MPSLVVGMNLDISYINSSGNISLWSFSGPQLFSGSTSSPNLTPGSFPVATGILGSSFTCFLVSSPDNPCMESYPLASGTITTAELRTLTLLSAALLLLAAVPKKWLLG